MFKDKKIVRELKKAMESFKKGSKEELENMDFDKKNDSIANFFIEMAKGVKVYSPYVIKLIKGVYDIATKISSFNVRLFHFSGELEETSKKLKKSSECTLAAIQQTNASMEQVTESMTENAATIDNISQKSEYLYNTLDKDSNILEKITETNQSVSKSAESMDSDMNSLLKVVDFLEIVINAHRNWLCTLESMANNMEIKPIQANGKKCTFGHFYYTAYPRNNEIKKVWDSIDNIHLELHEIAHEVIDNIKKSDNEAVFVGVARAKELSNNIIEMFEEIKEKSKKLSEKNISVF